MPIPLRAVPWLVSIAAACASAPEGTPPIADLSPLSLDYRADVRGRGIEPDGQASFDPAQRASDRKVEVECSVHRVDAGTLAALVGAERAPAAAWKSTSAGVERALAALADAGRCDVVTAPELVVCDGGRARISIADSTAYVADFELHLAGDTLVADPVIETLQHGIALDVRPELEADGVTRIALTLVLCDLQRPIPEVDARLPGVPAPVTVQTPVVRRQQLATEVALGAGDCALIVAPGDGGYRLVVVRARASA